MRSTIFTLCLLIGFSAYMSSCKKLDFNYRQFIGEGEITYVGKADSLKMRGGNHRAELSWLLVADPKVTTYKIYWDSRQDSAVGSLTKTDDVDTVRLILEDLEEKVYEFEVFLLDNEGNSSVSSSVIGQVWGDRYRESLVNRVFRTPTVLPGNELEIQWSRVEDALLHSEVRFKDEDNQTVTHIVSRDVSVDTIRGFPAGNSFEVRSAFKPASTSIDTFYTDFETYTTPKINKWWEMDFKTTVSSGTQPDQLSVWISEDFNGIYDLENVESATWLNITDQVTLATNNTQTDAGPISVGTWLMDNKHFYVAFRYDFIPGLGTTQRNWTVRGFEVRSQLTDEVFYNTESAGFKWVTKGPFQDGRLAVSSAWVYTLRGNLNDPDNALTAWLISEKIE